MGRQRQEGPASKGAERMRKMREERAAEERQLRHEQHRQRQAEQERRREILGNRVLGHQQRQFERAAQQAAALMEGARQAALNQHCREAWFHQCQRAQELERQVELAQNLITSLQEAAMHGGRAHALLQKALADKARVSRLLSEIQASMRPQLPRLRAVQQCEMAQVPAPHYATRAEPQSQTPASDEQMSEPTPAAPQPVLDAQPQQWRLCAKVRAIALEDQLPKSLGGHGYPPVTLRLNIRRAKRNRETTTCQPRQVLMSPKPLGPTSFDVAALSLPPQPLLGFASSTIMQRATAPEQSEQSLVQMLHTGSVRLGYVPVQRPQPMHRPGPWEASSSRDPIGHPFVIHRWRPESDSESACETPRRRTVDPSEVLVYATSDTD